MTEADVVHHVAHTSSPIVGRERGGQSRRQVHLAKLARIGCLADLALGKSWHGMSPWLDVASESRATAGRDVWCSRYTQAVVERHGIRHTSMEIMTAACCCYFPRTSCKQSVRTCFGGRLGVCTMEPLCRGTLPEHRQKLAMLQDA